MIELILMTAQIVIANTRGLALASDSAASRGDFSSNSFQKIFSLPGRQPLAFMVMGSSIHAPSGLSWDRIFYKFNLYYIGKYSRDFELSQISKYETDFLTFLATLTSDTYNERSLAVDLYSNFTRASNYLSEGISNDDYSAGEQDTAKVLHDNIFSAINKWKEMQDDVDSQYQFNQVKKYHGEALGIVGKDIVNQILSIDDPENQDHEDLYKMVAVNLCHHLVSYGSEDGWKSSTSTLVMGGFGKDDEYASYITVKTSSVIKGIENNSVLDRNHIDPTSPIHPRGKNEVYKSRVFIQAFANTDFTDRMTCGLDKSFARKGNMGYPMLSQIVGENTYDWLHSQGKNEFLKVSGIGDHTAEKLVEHLSQTVNLPAIMAEHHSQWVNKQGNSVKTEFRKAVERLAPIDLAKLAKHLIENEAIMTSFLRSQKSVDLPVDSCYVTKENGFIWTSLKNIPDPSINHKVFSLSRDGTLLF